MNLLMKQKLETYRKEIMLREFNGFEDCYNMFKDFYSDALKNTDDEQWDNREE